MFFLEKQYNPFKNNISVTILEVPIITALALEFINCLIRNIHFCSRPTGEG
jgi:hypothetical protein